ncbi:MAG: shikimate dehydrogenase [Nocardioides sp.]
MSAQPVEPQFRVGLIGHGIGPSLTPPMHVREASRLGLNYRYDLIDLIDEPSVDLGDQLERLESAGFAAVNVTHPYKQEILRHVDETSDAVERIGAANLVLLGRGRRIAHNTDYVGFRTALEDFLGHRDRGTVLQIGAGGAGLATACTLIDLGFSEIVVHDRDLEVADRLVARFTDSTDRVRSSVGDLEGWLARASGVVHVTPTGMLEHPGVAFDVDRLDEGAWVADVVYRPLETELLRRARARGLATLDGGAMAVGQAVESIRLITGLDPDPARMHEHFDRLIAADLPG